MERWTGRVALVTGASAGIGASISEQLAISGMKVVGCARNVERIEEMAAKLKGENAKGELFGYKCDLTNEEEIRAMFAWIGGTLGGVDVCINNAGMSTEGSLLDGTVESWKRMSDVNVIALCLCTQEAVKSMRHRGIDDGHIIHINSLLGHRISPGIPYLHFYSATKHAVTALTEGLRLELTELGSHIRVSSVSPGLTSTEFAYRMFAEDPNKAERMYQSVRCLDAKDVADAVVYVLGTPPHVQIHDVFVRPLEEKH